MNYKHYLNNYISEMFTLLYMLRDYNDDTTLQSLCDELGVEYDRDI